MLITQHLGAVDSMHDFPVAMHFHFRHHPLIERKQLGAGVDDVFRQQLAVQFHPEELRIRGVGAILASHVGAIGPHPGAGYR